MDIRRYTLSPSHNADEVELPPPTTRMMPWPTVSVKTRPQWGRACFADALLAAEHDALEKETQAVSSDKASFDGWSHTNKIRVFGWHLHVHEEKERFAVSDVRRCYDTIHAVRCRASRPTSST